MTIPAIAPPDIPEDGAGVTEGVGDPVLAPPAVGDEAVGEVPVAELSVLVVELSVLVELAVEERVAELVVDEVLSAPNVATILTAFGPLQQELLVPQHQKSDVAVPSQGVISVLPAPKPWFLLASLQLLSRRALHTPVLQKSGHLPFAQSASVHSSLKYLIPGPSSFTNLFWQSPLGKQMSADHLPPVILPPEGLGRSIAQQTL